MKSVVYLVPSVLDEMAIHTISPYVLQAVHECQVIFAENERTTRRFLRSIHKEINIDYYEWFSLHKDEEENQKVHFRQKIEEGKNIAIISEAGCPGIADPGQRLIEYAQQIGVTVRPLVGPSSILLALMASGMNGQQFHFCGYLPIEEQARSRTIRELEAESRKKNCTQLFIETPYRNNQLLEALLRNCNPSTRLCIASELTGTEEYIKTKTIAQWKSNKPELHKKPAIFLMLA